MAKKGEKPRRGGKKKTKAQKYGTYGWVAFQAGSDGGQKGSCGAVISAKKR